MRAGGRIIQIGSSTARRCPRRRFGLHAYQGRRRRLHEGPGPDLGPRKITVNTSSPVPSTPT